MSQVSSYNLTFKKPLTPLNGNLSKTLLPFLTLVSPSNAGFQLSTQISGAHFSGNYFALSRGVRQGCPLSPFLFVLAVVLLACKIRQDKVIKRIKIFFKRN